jgi:hypothetical protein
MEAKGRSRIHDHLSRVRYFFPFQLIVLHFKKNHFLLFFWVLLFGFTTGFLAKQMGVPHQFLIPEYRGATGFISFGIVGFALGGFITAFNLYTYIMNGYRFPFIATLSRPFHKFCLNNFIIPAVFILTYAWCSGRFQLNYEYIPLYKVILNLISFVLGVMVFQSLSYFYFRYTNKDARSYGNGMNRPPESRSSPVDTPLGHTIRWFRAARKVHKWHVETYLVSFRRLALARDSAHYEKEVLERVFSQNHINAARFELVLVVSFLLIGSLRESEYFVIPAAASTILFFTMLLMLISALHSWIKGWTLTLFVILLVVLNVTYSDLHLFRLESRAFGLNYQGERAVYDLPSITPDSSEIGSDIRHTTSILNRWRKNVSIREQLHASKPKLVIITCSGGGSRSAFWTMKGLAVADSLCDGKLFRHSVMMTGASGGIVGAAYLRELYLRRAQGESINPWDTIYGENMARDLLNPVILSFAVNDWFIRYQTLRDGDYTYKKDRGWAFEKQLVANTGGLFDKRLADYTEPENQALIPMMILSPSIVNDGRRLIIASQPVSYLTAHDAPTGDVFPLHEDVEFSRLFSSQNANNLRLISALRMNATFPYVLPVTTLPSEPEIGVMDAGIRDNFGMKTTYRFLSAFRNWVEKNTSGVIIVQMRDLPKGKDLKDAGKSLFGVLMTPMGSIYGNMTRTQDYTNQHVMSYIQQCFNIPVDLVTLQLEQDQVSQVSLSWHLTQSEKNFIRSAVHNPYYQSEVQRLKELLSVPDR